MFFDPKIIELFNPLCRMHYEEDHDGQCTECEFVSANPTILKKHKKSHCLLYTCDLCVFSTQILQNLNDHIKRLTNL